MTSLTPMELEVARLIVESLKLDTEPSSVLPEQALYREGLGLDSIDMLELSVVILGKYGFQIKSDDPDITTIFSSLRQLSETIRKQRIR